MKNNDPAAQPPKQSKASEAGPHPDQREELIQRYQAHAMNQLDPLRANLGVINADLMRLFYQSQESLHQDWENGFSDLRELAQQAERALKYARQIDRLARVDREFEK